MACSSAAGKLFGVCVCVFDLVFVVHLVVYSTSFVCLAPTSAIVVKTYLKRTARSVAVGAGSYVDAGPTRALVVRQTGARFVLVVVASSVLEAEQIHQGGHGRARPLADGARGHHNEAQGNEKQTGSCHFEVRCF